MTSVHHLKITLKNIRPSIWREILVPSDIRLDRLHDIIQVVMGWEDEHLHEFSNGVRGPGELRFGPSGPGFDDDIGPNLRDEMKAALLDLAPAKGSKFLYWYDFGDDWIHEIAVKAVSEPRSGAVVPACLKAAGACPPEDCGGPWGYSRLLAVLRAPAHEEYEEVREWLGEDWKPDRYDIAAVNGALARLAAYWNRPPKKATTKKAKNTKGK